MSWALVQVPRGIRFPTRWCRRPQLSHNAPVNSRVHPKYKTRYRVGNWSAYERALVQRGDVTLWLSPDAVAAWTPRLSGRPGGPRKFSDHAIETALTLRLVFRLPLRQAVRALAVSPLADECLARAGRHLRLQHPLIEPYVRFWLQAVVRQFWILRSWNSAYCENAIGCNGPHEQQN